MFACGLVLLGICVFAWGLRYKLSLYDSPHAISRHMPAAKLLTGKERSVAAPVEARRAMHQDASFAPVILTLAFFVLMGAKLFPGFTGWAPGLMPVRMMPGRADLAAHFTRPPPYLR
jgi:hypothetical protein